MIIYTTEVTLLAESLDSFPDRVGTMALGHGGYVAGVETREENGVPSVVVKVKVPPKEYDAFMRGLRGLGLEVRDEKATTQDVTEEFSDVQTQIASLEATHAQLLELMKRTGSVEELLKVQQQAQQVKLQIDRLKGRATALERLSDLATITVRAQLARVVLQRDYVTARSALRRAETTRASLEAQLKRAKTPEEEASIRDRLGEVALEITRLQSRIADLERTAASAHVELPTSEPTAPSAGLEETLPKDYIDTRVALRRARYDEAELTRAVRAGKPEGDKLAEAILRVNQLTARLKTIQDRANQAGITLPTLTDEQEAALAGITPAQTGGLDVPEPIRNAWDASLRVLLAIGSGVIFLWWALPLIAVAAILWRRRSVAARA